MNARMALDKLKEWMVVAFLFLVPIYYNPYIGGDARESQEKFFQGMAMVVASLFFGNIWYTCFFLLNMVLFVVYGASTGGGQVLNVFVTGLLFACSRNFFKNREIKPYLRGLYAVLALSLFYSIFQFFRAELLGFPMSAGGQIMTGMHNNINGMFYHTIFHSMFMAIMLPALVLAGWWVGWLLIIPIGLLKCSGAILATAFVVPFIIFFKRRKLFIPTVVIMALLGGGFTIYDHTTDPKTYTSRFYSWHMMIRYTWMNPLGWGPDSFRNHNRFKKFTFHSDEEYYPMVMKKVDKDTEVLTYYSIDPREVPQYLKDKMAKANGQWSKWQEAHNEFLEFPFQYGLFGIIFMGLFIMEIIKRFMVSDKTDEVLILFAILCVYALSSTTQFPLHVARLGGLIGVILGAYFAKTDRSYNLVRGEDE